MNDYLLELGIGETLQVTGKGVIIGLDRRMTPRTRVVAECATLPFRDGVFHTVYGAHVLEHLDYADVRHCVAEAYRVLAPNGRIVLYLPNAVYWMRRGWHEGLTSSVKDNLWGQQHHPWDLHRSGWDLRTLHDALTHAGFHRTRTGPGRTEDELWGEGTKP